MAKLRSTKTATAKIVLGLFTAVSLIIAFACTQVKTLETKAAPRMPDEKEAIYFTVENNPEFPGGVIALRLFVENTLEYPEAAQKHGIQGKVFVSFVVDKEGNVVNAKIARGVDPMLDFEALRVVNSMPKWKPGTERGQPVNVGHTIRINFELQ